MINIIIADDHSIVRLGLKRILADNGGYAVVGEAASVPELKSVLREHFTDVLILDLNMPGGMSIEAIKDIKLDYPKLLVLVLSFFSEEQYGLRTFKAGAAGYLNKECAPELLLLALQDIVNGKRFFTSITLDMILTELGKKGDSKFPHYDLSDRELHVLAKIGNGVALTQISSDLGLSVKTVSTYRQRVLKKMQMTTNAELVRYVITHGDTLDMLSL